MPPAAPAPEAPAAPARPPRDWFLRAWPFRAWGLFWPAAALAVSLLCLTALDCGAAPRGDAAPVPPAPASLAGGSAATPAIGATGATATGEPQTPRAAKKNVLYLNSYQPGYKWSDEIFEGIREVLAGQADPLVDLQVEYMDSKKYSGPILRQGLFDLYKYKWFFDVGRGIAFP